MSPPQEWIDAAKRENTEREYLSMLVDLIEEGVLEPFMHEGIACVRFPHYRRLRERHLH